MAGESLCLHVRYVTIAENRKQDDKPPDAIPCQCRMMSLACQAMRGKIAIRDMASIAI
jgi:hypothetical protein